MNHERKSTTLYFVTDSYQAEIDCKSRLFPEHSAEQTDFLLDEKNEKKATPCNAKNTHSFQGFLTFNLPQRRSKDLTLNHKHLDMYNADYLNIDEMPSLPAHLLRLRVGMPIIRSLNQIYRDCRQFSGLIFQKRVLKEYLFAIQSPMEQNPNLESQRNTCEGNVMRLNLCVIIAPKNIANNL